MGMGVYIAQWHKSDLDGIHVFFRHFAAGVLFISNHASVTVVLTSEG
jgi:hypothetical protein